MKQSEKYFIVISLVATIVLALVKTYISNLMIGILPFFITVTQVAAMSALAYGLAMVVKGKNILTFEMSLTAMLLTFAASGSVLTMQIVSYPLYLALVALLGIAMFNVSRWLFTDSPVAQQLNSLKQVQVIPIILLLFVLCDVIFAYIGKFFGNIIFN